MRSHCHVCLLSCLSCPSESHSYLRVIAMGMGLSRTWLTQAADSPLSRHPSELLKKKTVAAPQHGELTNTTVDDARARFIHRTRPSRSTFAVTGRKKILQSNPSIFSLVTGASCLLRPASLLLSLAHVISHCVRWWTVQRATLAALLSWSDLLWRARPPPTCLLDELYATPRKSRSTSLRPSLLGQSTCFLPSIIPLFSTWTIMVPIAFLRRHKKAVNSTLLMVRCTSSSASTV